MVKHPELLAMLLMSVGSQDAILLSAGKVTKYNKLPDCSSRDAVPDFHVYLPPTRRKTQQNYKIYRGT